MKLNSVRSCLMAFFLLERFTTSFLNWAQREGGSLDRDLLDFMNGLTTGKKGDAKAKTGGHDMEIGVIERAPNDQQTQKYREFYMSVLEAFFRQKRNNSTGVSSGDWWSSEAGLDDFIARMRYVRQMRNSVMHGRLPDDHVDVILRKCCEFFADMEQYLRGGVGQFPNGRMVQLRFEDIETICIGTPFAERDFTVELDDTMLHFLRTGYRGAHLEKTSKTKPTWFADAHTVWVSREPVPAFQDFGDAVLREQLRSRAQRNKWAVSAAISVAISPYRPEWRDAELVFGLPYWTACAPSDRYFCLYAK